MNPVRFHPKAFEELDAAASYYENKRPGLGTRFLAEARRANERIVEFPTAARSSQFNPPSFDSSIPIFSLLFSGKW